MNFVLETVAPRLLTQADLNALEWDGEFAHFRKLYAEIYESMSKGNALMWGIFLDREGLIGQCFIQLSSSRPELADGKRRAYLYGFRIRPPYRNRGVGTRFLNTVENDLTERGFSIITLNVGRDNPKARRLYERRGYCIVGEEPGQWSFRDQFGELRQVHDPAWRMEKHFSLKSC
jgi:ribosomal protein S18 acetylase RimI-like enzyme